MIGPISLLLLESSLVASGQQSDLPEICLSDTNLDGMVLYNRGKEGWENIDVAIFRADRLWTIPLYHLIDAIHSYPLPFKYKFKPEGGYDASAIFLGFPRDNRRIVSFFNLNPEDSFHNNLLIIHDQATVLRYKISGSSAGDISSTLLSKHSTDYWPPDSNLSPDAASFYQTVNNLRVLFVMVSYSGSVYALNKENLDCPPKFGASRAVYTDGISDIHTLYMVPSRSDQNASKELILRRSNRICYGNRCLDCDPYKLGEMSKFARWLQFDTNMSIRLFVVGLISIMTVNSFMAIAFIVTQMSKVNQLT